MASITYRVRAAALIIAHEAQALAADWSRQIPPSITTRASGRVAIISTSVGPAYPNEIPGVRHPVFETPERIRVPWVTNEYRPFLAPACDNRADEAAAEIAKYVDDVAYEDGFR